MRTILADIAGAGSRGETQPSELTGALGCGAGDDSQMPNEARPRPEQQRVQHVAQDAGLVFARSIGRRRVRAGGMESA